MTAPGPEPVDRRPRIATVWREHRARWSLPLVIILIIGVVALIDHLGSQRISQAVVPRPPALGGCRRWRDDRRPRPAVVRFQSRNSGGGRVEHAHAALLGAAECVHHRAEARSADQQRPAPQCRGHLDVTSHHPVRDQSGRGLVGWGSGERGRLHLRVAVGTRWRVDVDGQPDQVASTIGYRDVASVVGSNGGKTVIVVFSQPFTDWRILFDHMLPAHIARRVGWNTGFEHFDRSVDLSAGPMLLQSATANAASARAEPPMVGYARGAEEGERFRGRGAIRLARDAGLRQ